ncbi:DUF3558 domain-containing protein [Amycolatopsis circi]|uniref:DUF3558 domain-containing protein n=1 Tax=Amycolatopsis circi TaxID=871959 RepID=UPI000E233EA3|nr:DUF3558 domain-containing protein [Amycolatopsis circi]
MTKTSIRAAATAILLLTLTACTSNPGSPAPSTPSTSLATSSAAPDVPQVANPLDVAKYEQNPCTLLTQAQAKQVIESVRTTTDAGAGAPICSWYGPDNSSVGIGFVPNGGGLASAYQYKDSSSGYFEKAPDTDGYPTVLSGPTDDRKKGGCQAIVGVKNDETFTSSVILRQSSPHYSDPCALAITAATAAIKTIKAGAR